MMLGLEIGRDFGTMVFGRVLALKDWFLKLHVVEVVCRCGVFDGRLVHQTPPPMLACAFSLELPAGNMILSIIPYATCGRALTQIVRRTLAHI